VTGHHCPGDGDVNLTSMTMPTGLIRIKEKKCYREAT